LPVCGRRGWRGFRFWGVGIAGVGIVGVGIAGVRIVGVRIVGIGRRGIGIFGLGRSGKGKGGLFRHEFKALDLCFFKGKEVFGFGFGGFLAGNDDAVVDQVATPGDEGSGSKGEGRSGQHRLLWGWKRVRGRVELRREGL